MKDIIRKSIRTGLIFGAIGLAVSLAVPAAMMGLESAGVLTALPAMFKTISLAGTANTALLFGLFGVLDPIFQPLFSFVFGDKEKGAGESGVAEISDAKQININIQQAPQQAQGQAVVDAKFQQNIETERMAALLSKDQMLGV